MDLLINIWLFGFIVDIATSLVGYPLNGAGLGSGFFAWGGLPGFGFPWQASPTAYAINTDTIYGYPGIAYYDEPRWRYHNEIIGGTGEIKGQLDKSGIVSYPTGEADNNTVNLPSNLLPPILTSSSKPAGALKVLVPDQISSLGTSANLVTIVGGAGPNGLPITTGGLVNPVTGRIVAVGAEPSITSVVGSSGGNSVNRVAGTFSNTATGANLEGRRPPPLPLVGAIHHDDDSRKTSLILHPTAPDQSHHEVPHGHTTVEIQHDFDNNNQQDLHVKIHTALNKTKIGGGSRKPAGGKKAVHTVHVGLPQSFAQAVATGTAPNVLPEGPGGPGSLGNDPGIGGQTAAAGTGGVGTDAGGPGGGTQFLAFKKGFATLQNNGSDR